MIPDLSSALWHLHRLDPAGQTATLLQLGETAYRQASFLDQRVEPLAQQSLELPLDDVLNTLPPRTAPARFIFHIGHCGSTLLSRALAAGPDILPLREPLTLRFLAAEPIQDRLLAPVMDAHCRVFRPQQSTVIKATSTCNRLIEPVLANGARAILIYLPLEVYLAGMLGKLTPARDLPAQAALRLKDWQHIPAAPALDITTMVDWQLAALAWMSNMYFLLKSATSCPDQTLLLNFESLLAAPDNKLSDCTGFLGLDHALPQILQNWPDVSTSYSKKPDQAYSAFNRNRTVQRGRMLRADDIGHAVNWAARMADAVSPLQNCKSFFT